MKNVWIMAQAAEDGVSSVRSEPISSPSGDGGTSTSTLDPAAPNEMPPKNDPPGGNILWIYGGLMLVMMYFFIFRGPRKKEQQQQKMVQALQKNDRIRTIGGILGTVIEVKGKEVVLKVDESTNTKIRISASAVAKNMSKDSE